MKIILQITGAFLLLYCTAGIALHALSKVEGFGHHCEMLLLSLEDHHLAVYTLTASLSATLFFISKKKRGKEMKKIV